MFISTGVLVFQFPHCQFTDHLVELKAVLSSQELARMQYYTQSDDRLNFVLARVFTRLLLADFNDTSIHDIRFEANAYGKPVAIDCFENRLRVQFNISHSNKMCVIAVGASMNIGVDVEYVDVGIDVDELARAVFHVKERDEIVAVPLSEKISKFYRIWTLNEAYVKAVGMGLHADLSAFNVLELDGLAVETIQAITIGLEGYSAAVATDLPNVEVLSINESAKYVERLMKR